MASSGGLSEVYSEDFESKASMTDHEPDDSQIYSNDFDTDVSAVLSQTANKLINSKKLEVGDLEGSSASSTESSSEGMDISAMHSEVALLQKKKAAAVESEDYGAAKTLKGEIDSLVIRIDEAEKADKARRSQAVDVPVPALFSASVGSEPSGDGYIEHDEVPKLSKLL